MDKEYFEDKLIQMTKPEVNQLKHEEMLANSITKANDKSALSLWWLSIPVYIILMLLMKSAFVPHTTLRSNLNELTSREAYSSLLFFIVLPVLFVVINFMSIRRIYFLSGSPKTINFVKAIWFNILIIICSMIILIVYLL